MSIGTTAALVMGGIGAAGSIGGALIGAHQAGKAVDAQTAAADQIRQDAIAAGDKASSTVNAATDTANATITGANQGLTDAQAQQLAALKPYIDSGQISLGQLQELLGANGPLAGTQNQFKFTPQDWQNDPQYDFIRQEAERGLQRQAAASGTLATGGTVRAAARLDTGLASTHLDEAFSRALQTYQTNRANVLARISGLTGLTGMGFQATGLENQDIGNTAQTINANQNRVAANKIAAGVYSGDTGLRATQIASDALASRANAQAAGDIAVGNAWNQGIGGAVNAFNPIRYGLPRTPGVSNTGNTLYAPPSGPNPAGPLWQGPVWQPPAP